MKKIIGFLSVQFGCLFFGLVIYGQKPAPQPAVKNVSKEFEIRLPVTVTDQKNNFVWCLDADKNKPVDKAKNKNAVQCFSKNDFVVRENGVKRKIRAFTDEKTNPPVYVGVLMDTSSSTAGKMKFSKRAASDFLYTVVRLRKDKGAFMTYDDKITLLQDFTNKLDLLDKAVDKVKKVGSQTSLYDAIWQFADEKLRNAPGRRVIVVVADGADTISRANLNDAIDITQRTETTVFGIFTNEKGGDFLTRLCEETGGEAFFSGDMGELERAFTKISKELQSQYVITFRSAKRKYDGRARRLEVQFKNKDFAAQYKIRSRTQYRLVRDALK